MLNAELELRTRNEAEKAAVSPTPVLITEQEVALGTAAALRPQPATRRRWSEAIHALVAAVHRALARAPQDARRPHRDYARHYAFLEDACMARAMERL
jgi:hypothetical protein